MRYRLGKPIGSLTQLGHIRIGKRTDNKNYPLREYISLAKLDDIVFGGWDIFPDNAYQAAVRAGVLDGKHLDPLKEERFPHTVERDHDGLLASIASWSVVAGLPDDQRAVLLGRLAELIPEGRYVSSLRTDLYLTQLR